MNGKLIKIERTINIYDSDNKLIREISIDIPLEILIKIVVPHEDDPLLYDGYELSESQIIQFESLIHEKIEIESNGSFCILECGGIYDWEQ